MHAEGSLAAPLVATKTHVPPARASLLSRPRLTRCLEEGLRRGCRLALVSAPAGYGKTTLLGEWVRRHRRRLGWVSLDEGDNDPPRFWAYFVAALRTVWPAMDGARAVAPLASGPSSAEAFLTDLLNEMAAAHVACAIVLDDYHLITVQAIHDGLAFLVEHLPPKVHLIVASRSEPPLPLARLRARGELVELRAADLAFTLDEADALLNRVMGLDLSAADAATVGARTEGWAVGLQLAALSMQGRPDRRHLIARLTGSHHFVLDYLVAEVLNRQPESVRSFLLQTAVLDSLCAALCNAVTGRADGQEMLERLEAANLFLIPLDEERRWFRYHYLFASSLLDRLAREAPDLTPALHHRACEWYAREGLMREAFRHALAARNVVRAAELAERSVGAMVVRGELRTALEWVTALPVEVVRSRTALLCPQGWALYLSGQPGAAEAHQQSAKEILRQRLATEPTPEGQRDIAAGLADTVLLGLFLARYRAGPERAVELAREALAEAPDADRNIRGQILLSLGLALADCGSVAEAADAFAEAQRLLAVYGVTAAGATAASHLARVLCLQGRLRQSAEVSRQALRLADAQGGDAQHAPVRGLIHLALAEVLYEWNELEPAERHARVGTNLGRPGGYPEILRRGYSLLARVKQARGDIQGSLEALRSLQQVMRGVDLPSGIAGVASQQARLALARGNLEEAGRWAREVPSAGLDASAEVREYHSLTLARLLIAQGRASPGGPHPAEAAGSLQRLLENAEGEGRAGRVVEILLIQALALQAQGRRESASAPLERALALGEPEGYVRTFVDEGEPARALLQPLASRGGAQGYVGRLLAAFGTEGPRRRARPAPAAPPEVDRASRAPSELVEPLSERELDVLRLIVAGLSTEQIARELYLSANTVKTHTRGIYGKLDVHSRAQAIRCARELRLV